MDEEKILRATEAVLFASARPLSASRLAEILDVEFEDAEQALNQLAYDYEKEKRGIRVRYIAGEYQMVTDWQMATYVEKLQQTIKRISLSPAAMESLAIIAYQQPVTRSEIDQIRGVKSEKAINNLLEKDLIYEVGRKETIGKPILYGTTKFFLEHFGLKSLADMPPLPTDDKIKENKIEEK